MKRCPTCRRFHRVKHESILDYTLTGFMAGAGFLLGLVLAWAGFC